MPKQVFDQDRPRSTMAAFTAIAALRPPRTAEAPVPATAEVTTTLMIGVPIVMPTCWVMVARPVARPCSWLASPEVAVTMKPTMASMLPTPPPSRRVP
jgi:hypothetical protein